MAVPISSYCPSPTPTLVNTSSCMPSAWAHRTSGGNVQVAKDGLNYDAAARKAGGAIGPQKIFSWFTRVGAEESDFHGSITFRAGSWLDVSRRYLGLQFKIGNETHYGWARMNVHFKVTSQLIVKATLTGYAYETEPDTPIAAGDTGTSASSVGREAGQCLPVATALLPAPSERWPRLFAPRPWSPAWICLPGTVS